MVRMKFAFTLLAALSVPASALLLAREGLPAPKHFKNLPADDAVVEAADEAVITASATAELAANANLDEMSDEEFFSLPDVAPASEEQAVATAARIESENLEAPVEPVSSDDEVTSDVEMMETDDEDAPDLSALFLGSDDAESELLAQETSETSTQSSEPAAATASETATETAVETAAETAIAPAVAAQAEEATPAPRDPRKLLSSVRQVALSVSKYEAEGLSVPRSSDPVTVAESHQIPTWRTSFSMPYAHSFYHHPLYFEDPNLERCGHDNGCFQSVYSGLHFYGSTAVLPAKMLWVNPHCPVYSLGRCNCSEQFQASEIFWKR